MRTFRQRRPLLSVIVLEVLLAAPLAATVVPIATDDAGSRNRSLERKVADWLQEQGLGGESRILILATDSRVFLLGVVPNIDKRQFAGQTAREVAGVQQVDNLLVVDSSDERKSDVRLLQDVQWQLDRAGINAPNGIHIRAGAGTVVLRGRTESWEDQARAIQAAFMAGAEYVISELTTGTQPQDEPDTGPVDGPLRYRDDDVPRYEGERYGRYDPDAIGRDRNERWIQSAMDRQAQQLLASKLLSNVEGAQNIYVLVRGRQAFLLGRVRSEQQKQRATDLARDTEGVARVSNRLIVTPEGWQEQEDSCIENAIEEELYWNPFVGASRIEVGVSEGLAMLSGAVDSFGALIAAVESAFAAGARTVRSQLQLAREPVRGERGFSPSYGYVPGGQQR